MPIILLAIGMGASGGILSAQDAPARRPLVVEMRLENQAISPVIARAIQRAIQHAEDQNAECLIIVLDTPGGLAESTRDIVRNILGSDVPVIVYVAPSGARAASAGLFITLAAHVAAMAPGTHIGAAHPVQISGLPGTPPAGPDREADDESPAPSPTEAKAVNDTVAWARSLAQLRGRNAEWAERAVRESASIPASEAADEGIVDFVAQDMNDLLAKLDGREVALARGTVRLETTGARRQTWTMWWGDRVLATLTNPNVAFLLLMFGFYGILFEFYSPGWGVAGTLGVVCLLMGFFALAVLPINYVGLALIGVALALFVAEAFVVSYGALTVAGAICLALGGLMLVDSPAGFQRVSLAVVAPVALATAAVAFFLVGGIVRAHRGRVQTGNEALTGAAGIARDDFVAQGPVYAGHVQTQGEIWNAVSPDPIRAGQAVGIQGRDGLTLSVRAVHHDHGQAVSTSSA